MSLKRSFEDYYYTEDAEDIQLKKPRYIPDLSTRPVLEPARDGSPIWDMLQIINVTLEREGQTDHPSFLIRSVWETIGRFYSDPFIVDRVPEEDMERIHRAIDPDIFDLIMSIPGVALAGGSTLPGLYDHQFNDLDFFVHGPDSHFVACCSAISLSPDIFVNELEDSKQYAPPRPTRLGEDEARRDETESDEEREKREARARLIQDKITALNSALATMRPSHTLISSVCTEFEKVHLSWASRTIQFIHFLSPSVDERPESIRHFIFDYHRCAYVRAPNGEYMRYRTYQAAEAHRTKTIKYFNNEEMSYHRLGRVIKSAYTKGYTFPRGVTHISQLGIKVSEHDTAQPLDPLDIKSIITYNFYESDCYILDAPIKPVCIGRLKDFDLEIETRAIRPFNEERAAEMAEVYDKLRLQRYAESKKNHKEWDAMNISAQILDYIAKMYYNSNFKCLITVLSSHTDTASQLIDQCLKTKIKIEMLLNKYDDFY